MGRSPGWQSWVPAGEYARRQMVAARDDLRMTPPGAVARYAHAADMLAFVLVGFGGAHILSSGPSRPAQS